ncbi:hypothetical protein ZYGR_0W00660 [Zygosaccharomyces rouxii]|uniref:ZYRO0F17710p n=2 Tax=Zygosaccharomyces rouxii TaxID=4956 RepID=C5DZ27_ZYGRC|nr:uncharacterized protein ZYRO0F17710g [Zygosaccharomyces rouxii]KAH9201251.1 LAS seventeen-binding protein 5 [Zygosaccharomyces rouxii]GAV50540.1 hypothetical protein ZYGR_0W00660 [Zygosaccharomyces rouxii]CAQ43336.1 LAS seventeen-binding protein 5 [Zygosaccharomyces rouxii]CAR29038.1 ZYRO0F17710p [Zygosaccharomyces rouxii]
MGFFSDHRTTSITSTIDKVTSRDDFTIEEELINILELIKNASNKYEYSTNQEEAARALRKKLKYGNRVQAWRAFEILDLCVSQGVKLGVLYNDPKLLDRVKMLTIDRGTDARGQRYSSRLVKNATYAVLSWYDYLVAQDLDKSRTFEGIYNLSVQVKKRKERERSRDSLPDTDRNNRFMDDSPADESIFASAQDPERHQHNPDELYRIPRLDMSKESPKIRIVISDGLAAATALRNALMIMPAGEPSTADTEATDKFEEARTIRRKILRYLQVITEGEHLGSLIRCNEELVDALSQYDERAGSLSPSPPQSIATDEYPGAEHSDYEERLGGTSDEAEEEPIDETDPFADNHKI